MIFHGSFWSSNGPSQVTSNQAVVMVANIVRCEKGRSGTMEDAGGVEEQGRYVKQIIRQPGLSYSYSLAALPVHANTPECAGRSYNLATGHSEDMISMLQV